MNLNQKPKMARFAKYQTAEKFDEIIAFIGTEAEPYNKTGQSLLLQSLGLKDDYKAVLIGKQELENLPYIRLTPEDNQCKAIRFYQLGEVTQNQRDLLAVALAFNQQAVEICQFFDNTGHPLKDENGQEISRAFSDYVQRIRQGEISEVTLKFLESKQAKIERRRLLKEVRQHSDGFQNGLFLFEYGEKGEKQSFLSSAFEVIGLGVDEEEENEHYTLLKWQAIGNQLDTIEALPNADLGTGEGWKQLTKKGLELSFRGNLRLELAEYIQNEARKAQRCTVSSKSGWSNGAYIMPNGDIIGEQRNGKPLFLRIKSEKARFYTVKGSLKEWQDNIARYAEGNSMIFLSIACALAAPLIHILGTSSFGFHLYAKSSKGKTASTKLGATLYGNGNETISSWKGTDNGIINEAVSHNDGLLVMDELTQIDPKTGKDIAYAIFNGEDKTRAKAEGGNRQKKNWNVLVISTGEKDLETQLGEYGIKVKAGELVRLINIPFENYQNFHEFEGPGLDESDSSANFVNRLEINSTKFYGVAGRNWIQYLSENPEIIRKNYDSYVAHWLAKVPRNKNAKATQIIRISKNFAVLHAACKCSQFITNWSDELIDEMLQHIFSLWIEVNGVEDIENRKIERLLDEFLVTNLGRFNRKDRNGFLIEAERPVGAFIDERDGGPHYFIYPEAIRIIFPDFEEKMVLKVLEEKGRLVKKEKERKLTTMPTDYIRAKKRAYFITAPKEDF